jgi:hypothetical protein
MKLLTVLFLASLLLGQLGGISPWPGVVIYIHDIFLAILVVLYVRKVKHAKRTVPIALFTGACLMSLLANYWRFTLPELLTGSLYLVRWVLYAGLYVVVAGNFVSPRFWLKGLYAVGIGFGVLGFMQFFLYPNLRNLAYLGWDPHYYRLFSTLLDPNFMGIILVFTVLLGFRLFRKNSRWIIAGQTVTVLALLLTYSRSSFLALGAAVVVWAVIEKRWKLFIVLAVFVGLVLILPHGNTLSLLRADSTLARVGNWGEGVTLVMKAPVFGYGFDTLRYARPSANEISKSAAGLDSSILFILATTGLVGCAAYANLVIAMIRAGRHATFYIASVAALLVHSLFVNSLFYPWVMIWMWIVAGAVTYDT